MEMQGTRGWRARRRCHSGLAGMQTKHRVNAVRRSRMPEVVHTGAYARKQYAIGCALPGPPALAEEIVGFRCSRWACECLSVADPPTLADTEARPLCDPRRIGCASLGG